MNLCRYLFKPYSNNPGQVKLNMLYILQTWFHKCLKRIIPEDYKMQENKQVLPQKTQYSTQGGKGEELDHMIMKAWWHALPFVIYSPHLCRIVRSGQSLAASTQ